MVVESSKIGQYRFAVASGESQNADDCLILETYATLPRLGTDRSGFALPIGLLPSEMSSHKNIVRTERPNRMCYCSLLRKLSIIKCHMIIRNYSGSNAVILVILLAVVAVIVIVIRRLNIDVVQHYAKNLGSNVCLLYTSDA